MAKTPSRVKRKGGKKDRRGGRVFDSIAMEVFSNRLLSITEDMGNTLVRSSFSTNIKERKDCSVGLFDARGRCICQGSHVPLHLGSLLGGVEALLARYRIADVKEGDAFICNDPFLAGGTHNPDVSIITPVFWDGRLRFFTANIGHHADFGGSVPGSISAASRTIFEEGLRLPVIRLKRAGVLDEDLLYMIVNNTRVPEERDLDLRVQIATNERGAAMVKDLIGMMGMEAVEGAVEDLLAYTRRRLRNRVAKLADGAYSFTRFMDDDGTGGDPVPLSVTVRIKGSDILMDFTGSGTQARGAMNVAESALKATAYYCVKALLDPELLPNSGMFEAIHVSAPEGTITNPHKTAAVGARSITCNKLAGAIYGAFTGLLPKDQVQASGHDNVPAIHLAGNYVHGHGIYVYGETVGGGAGARHDRDGMDCVHIHVTNTSNLPAEAMENEYRLLVDAYAMVEDSAGAGRHRGGCGIVRQIQAREDGVILSCRSDGHVFGSPGIFGGRDGHTGRLILNHGQRSARVLPSKVNHAVLNQGDSMRLETAGGGGYGPPRDRPLDKLAADIRSGVLSRKVAEDGYGVAMVRRALGEAKSGKSKPGRRRVAA